MLLICLGHTGYKMWSKFYIVQCSPPADVATRLDHLNHCICWTWHSNQLSLIHMFMQF